MPKRAGHLNEETHFVLNRFGVEAPEYIKDVRPQVMNIEIRHTEGINSEISVRNAWKLMDTLNVVTLPITEGRKLTGLVSIDDIAKSYFETFDNRVLSNAKTSFANIVETLGGRVITGDESEIFDKGKMIKGRKVYDPLTDTWSTGYWIVCYLQYKGRVELLS